MTIKKHNYLVLIEAKNCNPNGDPDNENQPRIDPDSEYGIITNQCLNRKIRNQILLRHPGEEGFDIYIQNDTFLNGKSQQAYTELGYTKKDSSDKSVIQQAKEFMLKKYFDVRTFGAVMSTGDFPAGRVTGTDQLCNQPASDYRTGNHPDPSGRNQRRTLQGKRRKRNGQEIHCSLRSLRFHRKRIRSTGRKERFHRSRSQSLRGSTDQYVRERRKFCTY